MQSGVRFVFEHGHKLIRFSVCLSAGHCSEISCVTHVLLTGSERRDILQLQHSSVSLTHLISVSSCLFYLLFTCSIHLSCSCCHLSLQRSGQISQWCQGPSGWRSALRWKGKRRWLRLMGSTHVYTRYM